MRIIQIPLLLVTCYLLLIANVQAFTMEDGQYRLQIPDVQSNDIPMRVDKTPRVLGSADDGLPPFSFTLSSLLVDFGPISPTDPVTRTTSIIVNSGRAKQYTVMAQASHPLRDLKTKAEIADTRCDNGICNESIGSAWVNPLVFGAGFRINDIQGETGGRGFEEKDIFKHFPDREASEAAKPIMDRLIPTTRNDEIRITYKVNTAASQSERIYQNIIEYIAVPSL